VVQAIRACGGEAIADGSNVASWDGAHALFANAMKTYGDVDASSTTPASCATPSSTRCRKPSGTRSSPSTSRAALTWARAAAPHFKERQKGAFVHMTSPAA